MKPPRHRWLAACIAVAGLAGTACSQPPAAPPAPPTADSGATLQALMREIGQARCDSTAQCRTIAVGHKSCGGPERYIAYSSTEGDGARIAELAARHASQRQAEAASDGRVSNCQFVTDPGARCVAQRCTPNDGTVGVPGRPAT